MIGHGARLTRRTALALATGGCLAGLGRRAQADAPPGAAPDNFPASVTLIVAGPEGGRLDTLSKALATGLQLHLPAGTTVGRSTVGGVDGVTGANQFATQTAPDGGAVLLVPGAAPLAWLVGDSRVHFDPSHWLPVLAGVGPNLVVARRDHMPRPGAAIRVAGGNGVGPALAAMLAIDLLGASVTPVLGLDDENEALMALAAGRVDAVLVRNHSSLDRLAGIAVAAPVFSLGIPTPDGEDQRDPTTPDTPTLLEYNAGLGRQPPHGPRYEAWRCAAATAQLRYALVLPSLTPSSAVALWRDAGTHAFTDDLAASSDVVYAAETSGLMHSLNPDGAALLDFRSWLATKLNWQPG